MKYEERMGDTQFGFNRAVIRTGIGLCPGVNAIRRLLIE